MHAAVRAKQQAALVAVRLPFRAARRPCSGRRSACRSRAAARRRRARIDAKSASVHAPRIRPHSCRPASIFSSAISAFDELERCDAFADEVLRLFRSEALDQLGVRQAMAVADHPARAARCAVAGRAGVERDDGPAGARERQRRGESRVARADDRDVARGGQRHLGRRLARRRIPPVGLPENGAGLAGRHATPRRILVHRQSGAQARGGCACMPRPVRSQSRHIHRGKPMKKLIVAIVSLAFFAALPAFAQKKTLVVGSGTADAGKLDPHIASTTPDKGLLQLDVQRPRPNPSRPDQPGIHRARSRRELDVESRRHRMDVQASPRRPVPPRLRRVHRRGRRLLDQAREQQGDLVVLERFQRASTRSRRSTSTR